MPKFWFDTETFSDVPIRNGSHAYAERAEVLLFSYALDDGDVSVWDVAAGEPVPEAVKKAAADPAVEWWGHNSSMFDWPVIKWAMPWLYEAVPQARRRDTMIQAYSHSLPGGLGVLCEVLGVKEDEQKGKDGKVLIRLFCIPPAKSVKRPRGTRHTHPKEWEEFKTYAGGDIVAMRAAHRKMPQWNYPNNEFELRLFHLDNLINNRGIAVDVDLALAAIDTVEAAQVDLAARTATITDNEVQAATQRDAMLRHVLKAYGVTLPDMQSSTLERRIADPDLPEALRELLQIRLQASTTSTSKYKALLNAVSSDGRLRGTLQFCGAARTGRWAGRLFQPQNLPRVPKSIAKEWDVAVDALKYGAAPLLYPNVMELAGACVRGCIVAPPGKRMVVADLSNIEGRMLAWLAGEEWKLKAFRDFDAGVGYDLYKLAYAKAFGVKPEDVDDFMRQIGKVMELALGYEGGVGAFMTFSLAYGIDLEAMAEKAYDAIPADVLRESKDFYAWTKRLKRNDYGLSERAFVVCDAFKRSWRYAHPETVKMWRALGDAVVRATNNPGTTIECGRFKVRRDGVWLRVRLPSGRFLCYPSPQVDENGKFSYMGVNQYSRKWDRISSYSGKVAENVTQAAARDVIAHGLLLAEEHGYHPITSIHDEAPTETPDTNEFTHEGLSALLSTNPGWAPGLPLAAAGFTAYRYRKG